MGAERLIGNRVSDTTLRARRDEWVASGVFDSLADEALVAYDRIIGLDLTDCSVDASLQKAPRAQDEIGPSPVDRGKRGWKWSLFADRNGIPLGWVAAGANRNDCVLVERTLAAVAARGLIADCDTLHLDRGYDNGVVRAAVAAAGVANLVCSKVRPPGEGAVKKSVPHGLRWPIERSNSWLSNFGQLRRNTDRRVAHRVAQLALAVVFLLTAKLIDWRDAGPRPDAYPRSLLDRFSVPILFGAQVGVELPPGPLDALAHQRALATRSSSEGVARKLCPEAARPEPATATSSEGRRRPGQPPLPPPPAR